MKERPALDASLYILRQEIERAIEREVEALAAEVEKLREVARKVPHLEQIIDPLTQRREGRHHYRVDKHVIPSGAEDCRRIGGQCAMRDALAKRGEEGE